MQPINVFPHAYSDNKHGYISSDLERRQSEMSAVIGVLKENKQSWQKIGELEAKVRQLEVERTRIVADNDRMKAEKDAELTKLV